MLEVKVTRARQITIPAELAHRFGIRVGDTLLVAAEGDRIVLIPKKEQKISLRLGKKFDWRYVERVIDEESSFGH